MVNLLFDEDAAALSKPGIVRTIYDPTAGTGDMLSVAEEYLVGMNPSASVALYGQERNAESYTICKADILDHGAGRRQHRSGNTLSDAGRWEQKFGYMLSNPSFGVEWKVDMAVRAEHEQKGHAGRFGPGALMVAGSASLPWTSD